MFSATFNLLFRVKAHQRDLGEKLCVVGNCAQLGNWKPQHAKILALESIEKDG